ncbi:MAG: hypothetical protein HFG27_04405 [Provencibacterium sp.]|jgi:hypothetical protein|nr:hypothetical protein [Provencibacterium sp.]
MDKLLLEVICPVTNRHYDIFIPKKMRVGQAIQKIADEISAFESAQDLFASREELMLCSYEQKGILNPAIQMIEAGIQSGDRLMLL